MSVKNGLRSVKLNHVKIESIYIACDSDIVHALRSLVILIPNNKLAAPRSVNEYLCFNLSL